MGLKAVVYKNLKNIDFKKINIDRNLLDLDEETGEVFLNDEASDKYNIPDENFISKSKRIGNIAAIKYLSDRISKVLDNQDSIILNRFLYSGIHSGDQIDVLEVDKIDLELEIVKELISSNDVLIKEFLSAVEELSESAKEEQNPIVFI